MSTSSGVLFEKDQWNNGSTKQKKLNEVATKQTIDKIELVWLNIIVMALMHVGAFYGVYLIITSAKIATTIFAYFLEEMSKIGVTAGVHRLWSHRSYKAKWPLRLFLAFLATIAYQMSIIHWTKNHRQHHKYSDTNADPHNSKRNFFFCHIGWLLCRQNAETRAKAKEIDLQDMYADPIVSFQDKYYVLVGPFISFVLPPMIAVYCWNETWSNAFFVTSALRWIVTSHITALVNSAAHMYGNKPYDRNIAPTQIKVVAFLAMGEGWHNYHHVFPWDYKTSEWGNYSLNVTNAFIDFFAWLGWAYDLKTVSTDIIKKRVQRTGDGTHEVWGWGDKDMTKEDQDATIITHKQM